jgi:thiamine-phosphate pyrophosphorylase
MQTRPVLCYITSREELSDSVMQPQVSVQRADTNLGHRCNVLLDKIGEAARAGVDFVQLREKDLGGRALERLALAASATIRRNSARGGESRTKLLLNARADVALAVGADGVHLPSHDLTVTEVRAIWEHAHPRTRPTISVACHTLNEVRTAADDGADFVLFAAVFGKKNAPGLVATGIENLRDACRASIPVLALGGVTLGNARACLDAGATGIAGIRLFQDHDIAAVVRELRG